MMLKSAVFGISVAAIAAANLDIGSGNGRCHINHPYPPGTAPLSCEDDVTFEDVNGSCGGPDNPCLSTMDGLTTGDPRCNSCYKVTYSYEGLSDGEALELCKDGVCPAYTAEVYIKVKDYNDGSHDGAKFEMTQNAWSKLCPYVCAHSQSEICVQDAATCEKYGPIADNPLSTNGHNYVEPGSCRASMKPIKWEQLEKCGDTVGNPPVGPSSSSTTPAPVTEAPAPPPAPVTEAPAPPPAPVTEAPAPPPAPVTEAPAPAPSPNAKCFRTKGWFFEDCESDLHCNAHPEYTTEETCKGDGSKLHMFVDNEEECRYNVYLDGWCNKNVPPPPATPKCFKTDGWFFEECDSPKHCNAHPEFKSEESCKGDGSKLHYFVKSEEECRQAVIDNGWCTYKPNGPVIVGSKATDEHTGYCFESAAWYIQDCNSDQHCMWQPTKTTAAACKGDGSKLTFFGSSEDRCRQSIVQGGYCYNPNAQAKGLATDEHKGYCFESAAWYIQDCNSDQHCMWQPTKTTAAACKGDGSKLTFFGSSENRCRQSIVQGGYCYNPDAQMK